MSTQYKIALVEPFFSGSHRRWAEGVKKYSRHHFKLFTLPGRHWKWRMHGAAITLAKAIIDSHDRFDAILTTDMMDLATFKAIVRQSGIHCPVGVYFHENQLTYPWSPSDVDVQNNRDRHYGWINYTTALLADRIWFNSAYHKTSFLEALPNFLSAFPDSQNMGTVEEINQKSEVLPLSLNLKELIQKDRNANETPTLLWNHRWEYDKNPEAFFLLCRRLKTHGHKFRLIVCGERTKKYPGIFDVAEKEFENQILHWGYLEKKSDYYYWLRRADFMPVTSNQDFFGGSVVEGIASGCIPLLPHRLAYAEHLPAHLQSKFIYKDDQELFDRLGEYLQVKSRVSSAELRQFVGRYDWLDSMDAYDWQFQKLVENL